MIREAQASRADIQDIADKVAKKFVPAMLMLAMIVTLVWLVLVSVLTLEQLRISTSDSSMGMMNGDNSDDPDSDMKNNDFIVISVKILFALKFGLATLLTACSCAMGLATPTAVVVATGVAADHGILLKSA